MLKTHMNSFAFLLSLIMSPTQDTGFQASGRRGKIADRMTSKTETYSLKLAMQYLVLPVL